MFLIKSTIFVNNIKEGGIIIKRLLICLVSAVLFMALTFNVKNVFATDTNLNNNGTNNNGTNNNDTNNNGINNNGTNNNGTDLNDDNDINTDTDNNDTGTDNDDDDTDTVDDDTDNDGLITNLLYGAGGIVIGSALTYFLSRNRDTI